MRTISSKFFAPLFIFSLYCSDIKAVERVDTVEQHFWAGYLANVRLNPDWSVRNDWQLVPGAFFISRHGLTRHMTSQISLSAGYAYVLLTVPGSGSTALKRQEHRPWAQLMMSLPLGKKYKLGHRIRYEGRYKEAVSGGAITGGYGFNHRIRFMTSIRRPIFDLKLGENHPFLTLGNEIHMNLGENVVGNNLDQNWTYLMLGYQVKNATFQLGYMYRFIPKSTPATFNHDHTATLWITQAFLTENATENKVEELLHRDP